MTNNISCALAILAYFSCTASYAQSTIQIAGHPFRSAENCVRKAPIGRFDRKCDIPLTGWRGAEGLWLPVVQSAGL
ncbi:hypothetical protein BC361_30290 [Ensifer sp. LC54]|nr:hypothetical protein BC361_30290 [Ensifer sp. LC54]OCP19722.1 hypothetical protein BC363_30595 [Ensifer sp. LC384]